MSGTEASIRSLTTMLPLSPSSSPASLARAVSGVTPMASTEKLFTLRTVEDTFRIKDYINTHHPKSVVLAGGGFISLELAENLRELGMEGRRFSCPGGGR